MNRSNLYNRDVFEVFASLPDGRVDAIISDPPYATTALAWDQPVDWPRFWQNANRACREEAVMILFAAQPFATDLINSNRRDFRYELIWHKKMAVGWLDAKRRPLRAHENILVFARHLHRSAYTPQMESGHKPYTGKTWPGQKSAAHYGGLKSGAKFTVGSSKGERYPRSVLHFANRSGPSLHPTQKPLALLEWLVRTYSRPGDVVFDPFMGSGTTGVACAATGRDFIGVERDLDYFVVAENRIRQAFSNQQDQAALEDKTNDA